MHEKGHYIVQYGSIYTKDKTFMIDNPALIISKSDGIVLKIGDINYSDISNYYQNLVEKYNKASFIDMTNDLFLLTFDRYNGILSIDDICTLINYFINHIGEQLMITLQMDEKELRNKIRELQEIGF